MSASRLSASQVQRVIPLLRRNLKSQSEAPTARASVAAVFRWREPDQRTLELLFVRRSINPRDAWSGQIAFPGGKRQHKNDQWENAMETAQRETNEEIGLDLTQPHVHWLGSLPAIQTHLRSVSVSTQVFLLDSEANQPRPKFVLQPEEIADVFWVDIQELFNTKRYHPLLWDAEEMIRPLKTRPQLKQIVDKMLGRLKFGSIYLPRPTASSSKEADEDAGPERKMEDFVLWGLTLHMVTLLMGKAECPLPMESGAPQFESRLLGKLAVFVFRHPDKALLRGASLVALAAAMGMYSSSRL